MLRVVAGREEDAERASAYAELLDILKDFNSTELRMVLRLASSLRVKDYAVSRRKT